MVDRSDDPDQHTGDSDQSFLKALQERLEMALIARGLIKSDPDRQETDEGRSESA